MRRPNEAHVILGLSMLSKQMPLDGFTFTAILLMDIVQSYTS